MKTPKPRNRVPTPKRGPGNIFSDEITAGLAALQRRSDESRSARTKRRDHGTPTGDGSDPGHITSPGEPHAAAPQSVSEASGKVVARGPDQPSQSPAHGLADAEQTIAPAPVQAKTEPDQSGASASGGITVWGWLDVAIELDDGRSVMAQGRLLPSVAAKLLDTVAAHAPRGHASQVAAALFAVLKQQFDQKNYELEERLDDE